MGVVKVNAKEALNLFAKEVGTIPATIIKDENGTNVEIVTTVDFKEFLVNKHETALGNMGQY